MHYTPETYAFFNSVTFTDVYEKFHDKDIAEIVNEEFLHFFWMFSDVKKLHKVLNDGELYTAISKNILKHFSDMPYDDVFLLSHKSGHDITYNPHAYDFTCDTMRMNIMSTVNELINKAIDVINK